MVLNWRAELPAVNAEFEGKVAEGISRQEARKLKRQIAKIAASTKALAKRKEKRNGSRRSRNGVLPGSKHRQ